MDRVWEQIGPAGQARHATPLERWAPGRAPHVFSRNGKPCVLVTGATGFIGRRLVERLCARGSEHVRVLVRNLHKGAFLKDLEVEVVYGDLTKKEDVARAMEGVDVVYHLGAALSGAWEDYEETTIRGTERLVAAALAGGVTSFVHASTIAAYGVPSSNGKALTEDAPLATTDLTFYMKSKIEAERIVREGIDRGLNGTNLRLGIVFGPGRPQISRMGYRAGRLHILVGLNNNTLPGVYVDDAVDALMLAAHRREAVGKTYNVVDDPKFRKLDYLRAMSRHRGLRNYVLFFPATVASLLGTVLRAVSGKNRILTKVAGLLNPFHLKSCSKELRFDNSRIKSELGWSPRGDLEEQFRETFRAS
jgi:nucleoside-diphosphate-sugar epimerase